MTVVRIGCLLVGLGTMFLGSSARAEGLRCGDHLASTGSSLYEVAATCGDPDAAEHFVETRVIERRVLVPCVVHGEQRLCERIVPETIDIQVDRWTYDFGSNRFIEFARFEQGVLVHVSNNGTYGRKDPS